MPPGMRERKERREEKEWLHSFLSLVCSGLTGLPAAVASLRAHPSKLQHWNLSTLCGGLRVRREFPGVAMVAR